MRSGPLRGPVLLVAVDAGGAEVVSSWARRRSGLERRAVVEGPAAAIFARKLPGLATHPRQRLDELTRASGFVLAGTGWSSDLEHLAVRTAKARGVPVASFLDHWTYYPERFAKHGDTLLPDEIWVGDEAALEIARRHFPHDLLRLEPNPYFADVREELAAITAPPAHGLPILYVAEPVAADQAADAYSEPPPGYDEFEALAYFFRRVAALNEPDVRIRLRPHPSELRDKYDRLLRGFTAIPIEISAGTSLLEDCVWAKWVVGCETMAMVIALIAGRRVFTSIPPGGRPCRLPQPEIRPL